MCSRRSPLPFVVLLLLGLLTPRAPGGGGAWAAGVAERVKAARDRVFPCLVHLRPVFERSFQGRKVEAQATGSGVLVSRDGLVVTNFHVAGTAKRLVCTLSDRRRCSADLVGADAATDLALVRLRVDELGGGPLPVARFGDPSRLVEGDFVVAMGSPLGLTRSLSLGVVSCARRYLEPMTVFGHVPTGLFNTWIQTDAAINPGNSGGPLVDLSGRVIGINARGYRGAENLGFAIPADVVLRVVADLVRHGEVRRSTTGVTLQPSLDPFAVRGESVGALVASVVPGSPAARSGVRPGDRLLSVGGKPLSVAFEEDLPAARRRLARLPAGEPAAFRLARKERVLEVRIVPEPWSPPPAEEIACEELGATLRLLTDRHRRDLFLEDEEGGLLVSGLRPGGRLARARPPVRVGDVLLAIGGDPVRAGEDLERALAGGGARLLRLARGRETWWVALPEEGSAAAGEESP